MERTTGSRLLCAATLGLLVSVAAPTAVARADPTVTLPGGLTIPDAYALDLGRDPPRFAQPIDDDTIVSFDLLRPGPAGGPRLSVTYDQESRRMGDGADVIRLEFELRF